MANASGALAFTSHDTALCLIPPRHLWPSLDRLRSLYDKAYGTWPPHINLVYPFVRPEDLSDALDTLCNLDLTPYERLDISLSHQDTFTHKHHNTIFIRPEQGPAADLLAQLRRDVIAALGQGSRSDDENGAFQPHLTIAQSEDVHSDSHKFLAQKVQLLTPIKWDVGCIAILTRHGTASGGDRNRRMRLWGTFDLRSHTVTRDSVPEDLYPSLNLENEPGDEPLASYHFDSSTALWQPAAPDSAPVDAPITPEALVVASYNVLAEFEWPPSAARYPALVENLLSSRASADILVLQEVTDHFLPFLLADDEVRKRYPFATHGPPDQPNVGPLPSLLNIVVLSRFELQWYNLPLSRKHKGCVVATFPSVGIRNDEDQFLPWVLVACHLTQGLVDGAVVAKKQELQKILDHLSTRFHRHPWILAGDFNLTTSSYTINAARQRQDISSQSQQYLHTIDTLLAEAGFHDTWLTTRLESGESSDVFVDQSRMSELFEGEQGATFNPLVNSLAATLVGSGLNNRPQRYDRILVKVTQGQFRPHGFNMFGQAPCSDESGATTCASDHWGIRCLLMRTSAKDQGASSPSLGMDIQPRTAPNSLQNVDELRKSLDENGCIATDADKAVREKALADLRRVLLDTDHAEAQAGDRGGLLLVLVPVGSYGLGVWTRASDLDCLCLGNISPRTFFALAVQRLRRANSRELRILRRVKANSGRMLELEVHGIKVDLQYCAATSIAQNWPEVMKRPPHDPAFALPIQTLSKLKPARDLFYLRRSIPDMAQYRLAHLLIKAWAKARGIYSAKFGFLGGIHISVLLVPVCKALASRTGQASTSDVIATFFSYYAGFDWKNRAVFDPFFHKELRYNRTFREALCLLGWHAPALNTALNASVPTVRTMAAEFSRANALLVDDGLAWNGFLGSAAVDNGSSTLGPGEFLQGYKSYIKIDANYWGSSHEKGNRFIGWLESRCVMLLVDIDRKHTGIMARVWPARFVEGTASSAKTSEAGGEFHCCYLVGLEWEKSETEAEGSSKEQARKALESLRTVLNDFETRIRGDEKYYDATSSWMTASIVRGSALGSMQLDTSSLGAYADDGDMDDSEDELEMDEPDDDADEAGETATSHGRPKNHSNSNTNKGATAATRISKPPGLGKFRTATDVMNRIRWDGNLGGDDFIVGYEDRFVGACEKALEQWKTEQTDEEFIPQHRILYFKRKSDGAIVWERRHWIDEIFGSGIKTGDATGRDSAIMK